MKYLQLCTQNLPKTASSSTVFPFLAATISSQSTPDEYITYHLALLVSPENHLARTFLDRIGFEKKEDSEKLPSWSFFVCGEKGPFKRLTDKEDAAAKEKLSTYLTYLPEIKFGDGEKEQKPTSISVGQKSLDPDQFSTDAKTGFLDIAWNHKSKNTWLNWKNTDTSDAEANISFSLSTQSKVNTLRFDEKGERDAEQDLFELSLTPQDFGDLHTSWAGCLLTVGNGILDGELETRLGIDEYLSLVAENSELHIEHALLSIGIPVTSWATINIHSNMFAVRYGSDQTDIISQENGEGASISIEARFPLIMAPPSASPSALALLVPLIEEISEKTINKLLGFNFTISIGGGFDWNLPLLTYKNEKWIAAENLWNAAKEHAWNVGMDWLNGDEGFGLGGLDWSLKDLIGEPLGAKFNIRPFKLPIDGGLDNFATCSFNENGAITVPVLLEVAIGKNQLNLGIDLQIDPRTFRLSTNRLDIRLPVGSNCDRLTVIDLKAFAFFLPHRFANGYFESVDGSFDFEKRELVFYAPSDPDAEKPVIAFPGNLKNRDLSQRLLFEFQPFHPDYWPQKSSTEQGVYLRINPEGLSLQAKVLTFHTPNVLKQKENYRCSLDITPLSERDGKASEIVIIDNTIRKAVLYGELEVPGVDDLLAKVEIGMRQDKRGKPPIMHAAVDLDKTNGKPLANFSARYLQMQIDDMRARLEWDLDKDEWSLSVPVDASFMLSSEISNAGGLDDLRDPNVIKVRGLDLLDIHKGIGRLDLSLPDAANFTCLDGLFSVSLKNLRFSWQDKDNENKKKFFVLECDEAEFAYLDPGTLQVSVEVGAVCLEFSGFNQIKMRNPERIGIDVTVGDSVRFRGAVEWVDNDRARYFAAAGTVAIEGLPEAKSLVKIGTGRKENGQIVPNIVLYGSMDYEVPLFSGVVAKNFGAGIGINNRLTGVDERPNAEKLLANIDNIDPSLLSSWKFVERNGFYLSIVGTTIIASNNGGNSTQNVYVASLLLSIDVDLNIISAGKVWFASSVDYVRKRENWSRPALKGAIAILPRDQLFSAALESFPNSAIEANEQLEKILNKGHIKLSFLLSPSLVDFYLQDISYRDSFLGVDMLYRGSMRLAIFKGAVLMRADQMITGSFSRTMEAGPGGFSCQGDVAVAVLFGGLLSSSGLAAYGMIAIQIALEVTAWIVVGFSFTIGWGRWKKRISFSETFRLPSTRLDIGLRGAVAFNESGEFGFDGELSISVSICGYRLSISPSLKIRDEVIVGVRRRVAVFEKNLDAYRKKLLAGDDGGSHMMANSSKDTWFHYQIGDWHLLVPSSDAKWFTPKATKPDDDNESPFKGCDCVTAVKVGNLELRMPWCRTNWDGFSQEEKEQLEEIEATMVETALIDEEPKIQPLQNYEIITDPRIESDSREFWLDIDQALLPDHALPVRMKTAEQVLQSGGVPQDFNSIYGKLVNFLYWSRRAVVERRHSGHDLLPEEELEQRRGAVLYQLLQELANRKSKKEQDSPWVATEENNFCGLIFKPSSALTFNEGEMAITVTRDSQAEPQPIILKDILAEKEQARQKVRLQLPRQEYVVDKENDTQEEGRVIVRLPLRYEDEFFHKYLPVFDHFEVWRRIRGQSTPVLVGSYQLPSLTYLPGLPEEKPVLVVDPYIFSDEFRVRRKSGEKPQFDIGILADRTIIEYAVKLIPIGYSSENDDSDELTGWQPVRLHVPEPDTFPVDLAMLFDVHALYRPADPNDDKSTWTHFQLASMGDKRITLALTDEWKQKADDNIPTRPFEIWAEERPIVDAGFYAGSADEARRSSAAESEQEPADMSAEKPVVTLQDKFQVAVKPVNVKEKDAYKYKGTWKFSNPEAVAREGYAYRFYIRPVFVGASGRQTEGVLRPLGLMISKNIPKTGEEDDIDTLPKDDFLLDEKEKYFWYEKPQEGGMRPAAPSGRTVRQIEWIAQKEVDAVAALYASKENKKEDSSNSAETTEKFNLLSVTAIVRPLELDKNKENYQTDKLRRRIGISWNRAGQLGGGVDIQINDRDDSAVTARFTCECKEYTAYQHFIHNFSNDSEWRLTRLERAWRFRQLPPPSPDPLPSQSEMVDQMLYLEAGNPVLQQLNLRAKEMEEAIDSNKDWGSVAAAASRLIMAIKEFEQSPLNLNDEPLQTVIHQIEALIRYLFLGLKDDVNSLDDLAAERIAAIDSNLRNMLLAIDELNPQAADFEDSDSGVEKARQALLNKDYSRKLAAIIRRRMVIGEDVLAGVGDGLPLAATEKNQPRSHWLPRGAVFETIIRKEKNLPNVNGLRELFPAEEEKIPAWRSARLKEAIDKLKRLVEYKESDDRKKAAAAIVGKAAGLTVGLQELERQCAAKGCTIERRSHHRVVVTEDKIGTKVPEPVEMKKLLPDTHRPLNDLDALGEADGSEAHLVAYFNLLERMGFALDLAGTDETGEPLSQADLVKAVRNAKLEERFKEDRAELHAHYVYLITPREPDSEHRGDVPDPTGKEKDSNYFYIGLSFVKLVIVPRSFHNLLISSFDFSQTKKEPLDAIKYWLSIRGILLDKNEEKAKKQLELFARAAYFAASPYRKPETEKLATGILFQIRLTPLQLHHITVPHVNGFAHIEWETPDRRGHRFAISARSMSRYEPLIRWADNLPQPQISRQKNVPVTEIDVRRIMTKEDGVDLPVPLQVSSFPHPEQLRFAYTLPSAGVRSLLNRISLIRTGYRGCQLSFRYKLVDHDQPEKLGWNKIIESITLDETPQNVFVPVIVPTPRNSTEGVRLFRHERLITLEKIPYFYAVQLAVNAQFEGDLLDDDPPQLDGTTMTVPEYGRRMPVVIAYRQPIVSSSEIIEDCYKYTIEVALTRLGEMASPAELAGGIPRLTPKRDFENSKQKEFLDIDLPVPFLGYHFYYQVDGKPNQSNASSESVYQSVIDLLMPWHEEHDAKEVKPFVRTWHSDIQVVNSYPAISLKKLVNTEEAGGRDEWVPVVTLEFKIKKESQLFRDSSLRYIQVSCLGKLTPPTLLR